MASTSGSALTIGGTSSDAGGANSAWDAISARSPARGHHIVGAFKETGSRAKNDRIERKKVLALAQAREIDVILATELSRRKLSFARVFDHAFIILILPSCSKLLA